MKSEWFLLQLLYFHKKFKTFLKNIWLFYLQEKIGSIDFILSLLGQLRNVVCWEEDLRRSRTKFRTIEEKLQNLTRKLQLTESDKIEKYQLDGYDQFFFVLWKLFRMGIEDRSQIIIRLVYKLCHFYSRSFNS